MAQTDLFSRLKRLFSTNTIVRNIGGRKLKIVDTGQLQSNIQTNLVDRYTKLYSNMQQYGYNDQLYQQQLRLGLFRDYETMDSDSIIASALDIYSDESTMKNEYGKVLDIQTDNGLTFITPYLSIISNCKKKSPYLVILRIHDHKLNSTFKIS